MNKSAPIGIFDSGVGGTSIWQEIHTLLPYENTLYLADSKHAPYGEKSKETILELSIKNTELLLSRGSKIIVVACNTATTNAISELRKKFDVPFIGIEPAIKPAALKSRSKNVGILATKGTLSSDLFHKTSEEYSNDINFIEVIGKGLVHFIEKGQLNHPKLHSLLLTYLEPMIEADVDYIVLGCSHYPYIIPAIRNIVPEHIKIIDSGVAVARQTKSILEKNNLLNESHTSPKLEFYSNLETTTLNYLLKEFKSDVNEDSRNSESHMQIEMLEF
ncbi:MAG: glutamate racemase [Flavobacteriaceae bacterium]|nr:glutamate racemase [Flavobacteriaceae bacterium]